MPLADQPDQHRFVRVAIPSPLRQGFDYLRPDSLNTPEAGARVKVPFGSRSVVGMVLKSAGKSHVSEDKIKQIEKVLDASPILSASIMSLLNWAADYYHHPIGDVFNTALPVLLRKDRSAEAYEKKLFLCEDQDAAKLNISGLRQKEILSYMQKNTEGLTQEDFKHLGFSRSALISLMHKGFLQWRENLLAPVQWYSEKLINPSCMQLSPEQENIIQTINKPQPYLLHGVTGSGKTEIYLQLIHKVLIEGRQVIVLVPEIGLTPQTTQRFTSRFNVPVEVMHSGLNDKERLSAWNRMRTNSSAILIGTRSAIFTPMMKPGLIVVDEEHDGSFKQNDGFRYSARDLAIKRGQLEEIPVILGSATPALESFYNANTEKYQLCTLASRAGEAVMPAYQIIDINNREMVHGFSRPLLGMIKKHLYQGNQVLIFLNRRGYAPCIFCSACRWTAGCRYCDASITYHASSKKMICHHCGTQTPVPVSCPKCNSRSLVPLGTGTERTESTLRELLPEQKIIRIDRDSTRKKLAMQSILADIHKGESAVLVGTQMLAKGHHFPNVTLVAIMDIDSAFFSSDYKAVERMGQLVLQVAGRAGREKKEGTVALQTNFPNHPLLNLLINKGYADFAYHLLKEREKFGLPPSAYKAILRADAANLNLALKFLSDVKEDMHKIHPDLNQHVRLLGPIPALIEKKASRYRAQLLLISSSRKELHQYLKICIKTCVQSKITKKLRWSLDVDPMDVS